MQKGRYVHDCDECKFIGSFLEKEEKNFVDYWYHTYPDHVTLIRRFSSEPSDNASRPLWGNETIDKGTCSYGIYQAYQHWVVHNKPEDEDWR